MSKALTVDEIDTIIDKAFEKASKAGRKWMSKYGDRDACGFAWVNVKPGTSRIARRLKARDLGRTDSYYGGVTVWMPGRAPVQAMGAHEAAARAFEKVLTEAGFTANMMSRMD